MKAIERPEVMKFWDYSLNKKKPESVDDNFTGLVNFVCDKNPDHKWKKPYSRYISQKTHECPLCLKESTRASNNQNIVKFFVQELNPDIDLDDYSIYDNKIQITWKCPDCKAEFSSTLANKKDKPDCPFCNGHYRLTTYDVQYPKLAERWSQKNSKPLSEVRGSENKINFLWNCPIHGEYTATINNLIKNYGSVSLGCPYCWNQKTSVEDSFGTKHPDLVYQFVKGPDPYTVGELSKKEAVWRCPICNEEYSETFGNMTIGLLHCYQNTLADKKPDFEPYYSSNNEIQFNRIAWKSNYTVEWICNKGHSYKSVVYDVTRKNEYECPYCSGTIFKENYNDVLTIYPELEKEEAIENLIVGKSLKHYAFNSSEIFLWRCPKCDELYPMKINERITYLKRHKESCPRCKGLIRTYGAMFG